MYSAVCPAALAFRDQVWLFDMCECALEHALVLQILRAHDELLWHPRGRFPKARFCRFEQSGVLETSLNSKPAALTGYAISEGCAQHL